MKNFYIGLHTYFNATPHNSFYTAIGGRFYNGIAPDNATFPYAVHNLISDVPENLWSGNLEDIYIQIDIYSTSSSSAEIEDAATACKALFDNCVFSVTGTPMLVMSRENSQRVVEEITTTTGTQHVWHYIIDYRVLLDP